MTNPEVQQKNWMVLGNDLRSRDLAAWLACDCFKKDAQLPENIRFVLAYGKVGLGLIDRHQPAFSPLCLDFSVVPRMEGKQPLLRAIGDRRQSVIDATAGLARDSLLMANHGFALVAIERSAVVVSLLNDALARCGQGRAGNFQLIQGDSRELLQCQQVRADVIYLDPMYPVRRKSSAARRKSIQILRALVGDDADTERLFEAALSAAKNKVVVKRPPDVKPLRANPAASFTAKLVRYDVYPVSLFR